MREGAHSPLFRDHISKTFKPLFFPWWSSIFFLVLLVFPVLRAAWYCASSPSLQRSIANAAFSIYLDFHALRLRHITSFTLGKFHFGSIRFADCCRPWQPRQSITVGMILTSNKINNRCLFDALCRCHVATLPRHLHCGLHFLLRLSSIRWPLSTAEPRKFRCLFDAFRRRHQLRFAGHWWVLLQPRRFVSAYCLLNKCLHHAASRLRRVSDFLSGYIRFAEGRRILEYMLAQPRTDPGHRRTLEPLDIISIFWYNWSTGST